MIHRTRQDAMPSGGPESGRQIIRMGDTFVEYSGARPTQAELDAHLNPPVPPTTDEVIDALLAAVPETPEIAAIKARMR